MWHTFWQRVCKSLDLIVGRCVCCLSKRGTDLGGFPKKVNWGTAQTSHLKAPALAFSPPLLLEEKRVICHVDTLRWSQWEGKGAGGGGWKEGKQKGMLGGGYLRRESQEPHGWLPVMFFPFEWQGLHYWVIRDFMQENTSSALHTLLCRSFQSWGCCMLSVWVTCGCHDDERAAAAPWSVYDWKALLHVSNHAWSGRSKQSFLNQCRDA